MCFMFDDAQCLYMRCSRLLRQTGFPGFAVWKVFVRILDSQMFKVT
jgi:hypothetical protein